MAETQRAHINLSIKQWAFLKTHNYVFIQIL